MRQNRFAVLTFFLLVPRLASPQGEPLGPEFRVNTPAPFNKARRPSIAAAGSDFVVVWDGSAADGYFPGGSGVRGQRYDNSGNPLGTEFRVNTYTIGPQGASAVGANASGIFVVVWENGPYGCGPPCPPPSGVTVAGQRYSASGAPLGTEFVVDVASYEDDVSVAVAPSGAFMVVWTRFFGAAPPGPPDVFGRRYDSSGVPQGPQFRVNAYTTADQTAGSVAVDPAGNFVVVWSSQSQYGSQDWDVIGQRYAPTGEPLGPQFRVNTYSPGFQGGPAVATDPDGNFVVAWGDSYFGPPGPIGVFGQRFASSGAPLGAEFRVNTNTTGFHRDPDIAVDGGGNFVITWHESPTSWGSGEVFAQRYSSLGEPSGPEFRVNTTTTDWQRNPSVASTPGGTFLVTWDSGPNGTGPDDVFGQRFGGIFPVKLQDFRVE